MELVPQVRVRIMIGATPFSSAYEVRSFFDMARSVLDSSLICLYRMHTPWKRSREKEHCLNGWSSNNLSKIFRRVGLGAVLIQEKDGVSSLICYASRSLSNVERRYSQTEKELLAIIWGFERFNFYLQVGEIINP